jgi:hypothetical protein
MDLEASRILCSQLLLYKNNEGPFNQPYSDGIDNPISWWTSMEIEPPYLQSLALRLFSISPNSASCERGFSMCGWITNKKRLRLGTERLESITKIISYYRSNAYFEFGFYGKGTKKESVKLSNSEISAIVNDSLAEPEPDDEDDDEYNELTTDGYPIPNNEVIVLIEKTIDVMHPKIVSSLGELPDLSDEDSEDDSNNNDDKNMDEETGETGRGITNYNVQDLLKEFVNDDNV